MVLLLQFFNQVPNFLNVENMQLPHFYQNLKILLSTSHVWVYNKFFQKLLILPRIIFCEKILCHFRAEAQGRRGFQ